MDRECKGCGRKPEPHEEMTMVAQWPFCPECFAKLMQKSEKTDTSKTSPRHEGEPAEVSDASTEAGNQAQNCEICGIALQGDTFSVGIWNFCRDCMQDLVASPALGNLQVPDQPGQEQDGSEQEDREEDEEALLHQQMLQSIPCAGCGRHIPLRGAKDAGGRLFCPDCFVSLESSEAEQSLGDVSPASTSAEAYSDHEAKSGSNSCESCGREVYSNRLQMEQGFAICSACLATDPALAVEIARSRHHRLMLHLRGEKY